jgi:hypothetical protein
VSLLATLVGTCKNLTNLGVQCGTNLKVQFGTTLGMLSDIRNTTYLEFVKTFLGT